MNNEMATNNAAGPLAHRAPQQDTVLRTDLVVPYVLCMQGLSEFVKERKAQMGDIVRSTTGEKLGDPDKPVEVVFLHAPTPSWTLEQKVGDKNSTKFEFRKRVPRNSQNEVLEWLYWGDRDGNEVKEGAPGASEWKRVKTLMVFALLPGDIEAEILERERVKQGELPDPNKALSPVALSFRVTSYKAGRELATFYSQAASLGTQIWRYTLPLGCFLDKNDSGSFYVWSLDRTKSKPVKREHLKTVETWASLVGSQTITVDDAAERELSPNTEGPRNVNSVC